MRPARKRRALLSSLSPPRSVFPLEPIRRVDEELLRLLRDLEPEDWARPASRAWNVREVVAHLVDGNLRRLSLDRDRFVPDLEPPGSDGFGDVLVFLDRLNADWIQAARRLSPRVLIELLEPTNAWVREYFAQRDPEGRAAFAVAWAGQEKSLTWLDVARDYTEKWHHQHQIRAAVGAPELEDPELLEPLLRTLVWSVPPAYAGLDAEPGTSLGLLASGPAALAWVLRAGAEGWILYEVGGDSGGTPDAEKAFDPIDVATRAELDASVTLDARWLWRLLLRVDVGAASKQAVVDGREELAAPLFEATALMVKREDR